MITIEPSGLVARVVFREEKIGYIDYAGRSVPVSKFVLDAIEDLPEEQKRTYYIVSSIVQQAVKGRTDLLTPHKTRWYQGKILGCKYLIQL